MFTELLAVRAIDLETHQCGVIKTSGKVPVTNKCLTFCPRP